MFVNARFLTQPITGVQRFAIELSVRLKNELGEKIIFVAPHNIIHNELGKQLDVQIIGSRKGHLWEQVDLPLFLKKQNKPLLINLCNTAPLFYNRNIITIHDIAFEVYPETYSKSFLYVYKFLIPRIIKKALKVITVSEFTKNEIVKFYKTPNTKIEVVYNAVSDVFSPKNINTNKSKYFLAVSSLNYRKNLPLVLEAFSEFNKTKKDYQLFIVGGLDTKSFSTLNLNKYKNNPNILFKGRVSDEELFDFYQNATAFIYPSFYEGFGIPPLEAQACGCPVILSNASCFPEIFEDTVLYCNAHILESLIDDYEKIVDPQINKSFIEKGIVNADKYNWDKSTKDLIQLLQKTK